MAVDAVVDVREPVEVVEAVEHHGDVANVSLDELPAGDIVIRDVAFERKTWPDFADAMVGRGDRSMDDQLAKLEEYDTAYVLIEGNLPDATTLQYTSVNPASLRGYAASVTARHNIPVIPTGSLTFLVDHAVRLARKHTEEPTSPRVIEGAVGREEPPVKRMYGCIPEVGPTLAANLYDEFPTVGELLAASQEEIADVDGFGPKRAEQVVEVIRDV